jgi:hypothetical protein
MGRVLGASVSELRQQDRTLAPTRSGAQAKLVQGLHQLEALCRAPTLDRQVQLLAETSSDLSLALSGASGLTTQARELARQSRWGELSALGPQLQASSDSLSRAFKESHLELARQERKSILTAFDRSCRELGLSVRTLEDLPGRPALLMAEDQKISVAVSVDELGETMVDLAGFKGHEACREFSQRLEQALERHGVHIQVRDRHLHGKEEGGALVQQAKRIRPKNPLSSARTTQRSSQKRKALFTGRVRT